MYPGLPPMDDHLINPGSPWKNYSSPLRKVLCGRRPGIVNCRVSLERTHTIVDPGSIKTIGDAAGKRPSPHRSVGKVRQFRLQVKRGRRPLAPMHSLSPIYVSFHSTNFRNSGFTRFSGSIPSITRLVSQAVRSRSSISDSVE